MKVLCVAILLSTAAWAQVTPERLLRAGSEPQNWLKVTPVVIMSFQRYSPLTQITPANVKNLELKWVFQANSTREVRNLHRSSSMESCT